LDTIAAAASEEEAAVGPMLDFPVFIIVPSPENPIPVMTAAGSARPFDLPAKAGKPQLKSSVSKQEPSVIDESPAFPLMHESYVSITIRAAWYRLVCIILENGI
jgi:hypothetical protein